MPMPPVEVTWIDAKAVTTDDGSVTLDKLEDARKAGKPVVIFAVTNRDYRGAQITACKRFAQRLFTNATVATALSQCVCIKVVIDDLPQALRQSLHLSLAAPQVVISSPDGTKLGSADEATQAGTLAALAAAAVQKVQADAEAAPADED